MWGWFRRPCAGCVAHQSHIDSLREELRALREQHGRTTDRLLAVADPTALMAARQAQQPAAAVRSFSADETGTTVMVNGRDVEVKFAKDGTPLAELADGRMVPLEEYERGMQLIDRALSGVGPAGEG